MMRLIKGSFTFFIACFLLILASCKKENKVEDLSVPKSYFPADSGLELVYNVDHYIKSAFTGTWDSLHYQIREIIAGNYLDNEGRLTQRIERYIKNDTAINWTIFKVWAANVTSLNAQREEDNIRYIRLYFVLSGEESWNGNSQNTLPAQQYHYIGLHEPATIGALSFDSTISVLEFEDTTLINSNYHMMQYAAGVGMVYKEYKDINYNFCGSPNCDTIKDAFIYRETLISFHK
jgi:hypothetical protein